MAERAADVLAPVLPPEPHLAACARTGARGAEHPYPHLSYDGAVR
ncbi:hypothetical protein [Streptomyces rishiriensis]|uniref:Uncharacterized protein n=1 Tax=Streptomyces rishiriensis TaxID=68264 RepID=A0ABU0NIA9_STRRH|nr:hypothetical protein [Streptomyces rishiriensis]MDQ0578849.1 hypothetical protein [Streptomyces rishiriensis]